MASKEAFDAQFGLAMSATAAGWGPENMLGYSGPMTREKVVQAHKHYCEETAFSLEAEAVAPDDACAIGARCNVHMGAVYQARQHALAEFSPVAACGEGGAYLRENIQR